MGSFHAGNLKELEMEPSTSGVNPIPYKCSLASIASVLQLNNVSTKLPTAKNKIRKTRNEKSNEKGKDQLPNVLPQADATEDLLYIISTTHSSSIAERYFDWENLRSGNYKISSTVGNKAVVSECGNKVVNNLRTIALERLLTIATPRDLDIHIPSYHNIELGQFKNDIAFLMVGIESHSFPYSDARNSFIPRRGLSANGLTPEALESFSTSFMSCGNLVRKLNIIAETSLGRGAIYEGFVFGIKNFLRLYQNLISTLAKTQNGGRFFQLARQLLKHVVFISKLCNLDQASSQDNYFAIPKGMDLLLYVLAQTRHISQSDLELVSISVLRATINPYLRFLSSWLFHGKCNQLDVEFGIQTNENFLAVRDRGFWVNAYTNSFDQLLPPTHPTVDRPLDIIFLTTNVVACGKALNLLRICRPSHPLCIDGMKFRSKLEIVVTPSQERNLRLTCLEYMNQMTDKMKQMHLERDLKKKAKIKKKSTRQPEPVIHNVVKSKSLPSSEEDKICISNVDSKGPNDEKNVDILVERDESERINAITKDLISYYNGMEPKMADAVSDSEHISTLNKCHSSEKNDLLSVQNKDITQPFSEGQNIAEGEGEDPYTKEEEETGEKESANSLPKEKSGLADDVRDIISTKRKKQSAQSIISSQNTQPQSAKNPKCVLKPVDEYIHTIDSEVLKYSFNSLNSKPRILKRNDEQPNSTKGLAPLELLVRNSVHIPLMTQLTLINKEILHFFLTDQNLFKNLEAICNYLLLRDNEFAFNLGYGLADAMEEDTLTFQKHPTSLTRILKNAIHSSSAASVDPLALNVGFSINQIITGQQHCSDIMDVLKLSYNVEWPLNIIITQDMINSYGQIFQLLLRMENVSITLNKTFMHLKQHRCLFRDFRFVQLQVIRHRMLNYITTIKTYIRNQIVVACWQDFQTDLKCNVTCLDTLWNAHSKYINKLFSRAFLYKETQPIRNILLKTLDTITAFTRILQQKNLICAVSDEETCVDSKLFEEAKTTYNAFHHLLNLFTSIVSKLETKGYRYHLQELLSCLRIASVCGIASKI